MATAIQPGAALAANSSSLKTGELGNRDGKLLRSESWQPFSAASARGDFFVSPDGDDRWSGTLASPNAARTDGPFASIPRARRAVRELKSKVYQPKESPIDARYLGTPHPFGKGKDIVVFIRQGFYSLNEPLLFTPDDGGERVETTLPSGAFEWHHLRDHYVTYAAYPGETPVISGGVRLTQWSKRNGVWVAPSPVTEVTALVANGRKQILARTPNTGYFTLRQPPASSQEIPYRPGDLRPWSQLQGNRVVILLRWRTGFNAIDRIDDQQHIAFLKKPEDGPGGNNGLLVVPPRYYVENLPDLLDAPGEWYFDSSRREISYLPAEGIGDPRQAMLSAPQLKQLVQVKGDETKPVRNLRFYGLVFEGARDYPREGPHYYDPTPGCTAITWEYASDCEFAQCELRACGSLGMSVGAGCCHSRIFRNRFDGLEQGALEVSGTGDLNNGKLVQITRDTWVDHNIFSECGHNGGITVSVGSALHTTIAHNYFTRSGRPYTINCSGGGLEGNINGDCVVEYNHFEDVQNDADDAGVMVVNGMTFNSSVRHNLIHRVHRAFFSDNVAFWFDNMSSHWEVTGNVYYDLAQGEMKTCGTYLSDNRYADNFKIEPPQVAPEQFIEGDPSFSCAKLSVMSGGRPVRSALAAGAVVKVRAEVSNTGSSGVAPVPLLIDGKVVDTQPFPVIRNNRRGIEFEARLMEPGRRTIGIGDAKPQVVTVRGQKPSVIFDRLELSETRALAGETVRLTARAVNGEPSRREIRSELFANGQSVQDQPLLLEGMATNYVGFDLTLAPGDYRLRIGNSEEVQLRILKSKELDLRQEKLFTYISPKANPAQVQVKQAQNAYTVQASGWDFYHAEDAYATVYLKQIKGDFVATAKIAAFGHRTSEWFRSGLFARNDITSSFDVERGSKGSVLMFSTPGRAGIEYDEFGDGCMHKAASENLPEHSPTPIWVRLERHGDRFTGYLSLDGKHWIRRRQTNSLPGLTPAVDLGLAAGSPDQKQYTVEFEDWKIKAEAE